MNDKPFCQIPGCHRHSATVVEVDLPAAWEASRGFTTLTIHAGLCHRHGPEVTRRVQAMLEARIDFYDLLAIIEQAVDYEKALQLRLEAATA